MPSQDAYHRLSQIFDYITAHYQCPVHPEQPWTVPFHYQVRCSQRATGSNLLSQQTGETVWVCTEAMDPDTDSDGTWRKGIVLADAVLHETQFCETEEIARAYNTPFKVGVLRTYIYIYM